MRNTTHSFPVRHLIAILPAVVLSFVGGLLTTSARADDRPRLLVLTDIGGDPDDQQSLIRLMLYSNEFDIEGLIATSAGTLGELKDASPNPRLIQQIVEAYGQVRPMLIHHADGYPLATDLLARIKSGQARRGESAIGETLDTVASQFIIELVDRPDPRPLNITIWGGQTDFAQALWRVRHERGNDGVAKFLTRLRVFDIDDQDKLHPWLFENFPDTFYLLSKHLPKRDKREGAYRGMYLGGDESLTSLDWLKKHVTRNHGPLGALYPVRTWTDPNPHGALKEGDTPSWFFFRPIAINDPTHPEWGGLGGRFRGAGQGLWRDVPDSIDGQPDPRASVWRWRNYYQNDFAARMDWCTTNRFADANHAPIISVNDQPATRPVEVTAKAGQPLTIETTSKDPDGQPLSFRWWFYRDAGNFPGDLPLAGVNTSSVTANIPADAAGRTLHLILETTDSGEPALTTLLRVVVQVE